ncbi:MAG TPA: trypsin-like peptidase domain-containing protein [Planctomycetaceae bacterium]
MPDADRPLRPRPAPTTGVNWLLVILLVLVTGLLWRDRALREAAERQAVIPRGDLAEDEKSTIALFKEAAPSVVHITSLALQRDALRQNVYNLQKGTGTGFVWDKQGHIVTNYHVIEKFKANRVMLSDRVSFYDATTVGIARDKDLAVLKIDAPEDKLTPLLLGTSADLQVGQKVFAIGNPFGFDQTLTTGVISALGREILSVTQRPIQGMIQTDAAINPGNSGGPLIDSAGRMIGVNTLIYGEVNAGIGFAVPADTIRKIVPQLIEHGKVERIGVGIKIWEDWVPASRGWQGVLVQDVVEGGPAAEAGIRPSHITDEEEVFGDLIVAANRKPVRNGRDLYRILDPLKAGDQVILTVVRDGGEKNIPVTLQAIE